MFHYAIDILIAFRMIVFFAMVQILDQANCILYSTNILGKGINPIILPPAMGK